MPWTFSPCSSLMPQLSVIWMSSLKDVASMHLWTRCMSKAASLLFVSGMMMINSSPPYLPYGIRGSAVFSQDLCDLDEHFVPGLMAVVVIDQLEIIQIDHCYGKRIADALCTLHLFLQTPQGIFMVQQVRHGIPHGQIVQFRILLFQLCILFDDDLFIHKRFNLFTGRHLIQKPCDGCHRQRVDVQGPDHLRQRLEFRQQSHKHNVAGQEQNSGNGPAGW